MEITGFSIPSAFKIPNTLVVSGFSIPSAFKIPNTLVVSGQSIPLPFVEFALARVTDKIGNRTINSITLATLKDSINISPYTAFTDKSLTFSSPPVSDETNFEFGWSPAFVALECTIEWERVAGRTITQAFVIPINYSTISA